MTWGVKDPPKPYEYDEFCVTIEHLQLWDRLTVKWGISEFGAPRIDSKRPYGNSAVLQDMREILDEGYDDERLKELHGQMWVVLDIAIQNRGIEAGRYNNETETMYGTKWVKRDDGD